jgi:hypothetical protein
VVALAQAALGAVKGGQVVETWQPTAANLADSAYTPVDWDLMARDLGGPGRW